MMYAFALLAVVFVVHIIATAFARERDRAERERLHSLIKSESLSDYMMNTSKSKSTSPTNHFYAAMEKAYKNQREDGEND